MRFSEVQMRIAESDLHPGNTIGFQGKAYTLGDSIGQTMQNQNANVAIVGNGYCAQHELMHDGKPVGQAWFYCYRSFQEQLWAVMDEVFLYEEVAA